MSLHAFKEYLIYRWKARGRHGTHSPFVYDLVAHVLLNKEQLDRTYLVEYPSISLSYENLISRIAAYFRCVHILPASENDNSDAHADMLLLSETKPQNWADLMNSHRSMLGDESIVAVISIHKTAEHTKKWLQLSADPNVRMSIDLYGIGLLLFKKEFKEKQHFILKY